jgi:ethanolamine utilization protein EutN
MVHPRHRGADGGEMRLGRVVGNVVATRKNDKLQGAKLLLVQPVSLTAEPFGTVVLAVDAAQAGVGDIVLLVVEGRAAITALGRPGAPVDAAILGIVDEIESCKVTAER